MQLRKLIRNLLTALAFAAPNFARGKSAVDDKPVEPIESKRVKYAPGGALEQIDKQYGRTIAGGPGSQNIYKAFEALPQAEKDRMILARKGIIRRITVEELDNAEDRPESYERGTDKIARALAKRAQSNLSNAVKAARGGEAPAAPKRGFA